MHLEDGKVGFSSFILSSSFSWHFKSYYSGASRAPYPTLSKPRSWIALSWDELSHPTRGKKALYLWPSLDLFSISYLACCFCYRAISFLFDRIWFFFVSVDIISASCRPISYHVIVPIAFAALRSVEKPGLSLAHTIPRRGGAVHREHCHSAWIVEGDQMIQKKPIHAPPYHSQMDQTTSTARGRWSSWSASILFYHHW